MCCMATNYDIATPTNNEVTTPTGNSLIIATGGKENDLKLWDPARPDATPIFRARNVS